MAFRRNIMSRALVRLFVSIPVLVVASVAACSSSGPSDAPASLDASTESGVSDAGVDGSSPSELDASMDVSAVDAPGADARAGECSDKPKQAACTSCCVNGHMDGAGAYLFAVSECVCVDTRCQRECGDTFCAAEPKDPDAACNACITANTGPCTAQIKASCTADPDCVAFDTCMGESGCTTKP